MKKLLLLSFFIFHFSFSYAQYMIYGVTFGGYNINKHQYQYGSIYKYNPMTQQQTVVFRFNDTDGSPNGRLLYASDSILYGIGYGGSMNMGILYSFNPRMNIETVLVNFDSINGRAGNGANELIEGMDGLLYGTTMGGGMYGKGVLFSYDRQTHKDSIRVNFNDSTSNDGMIGACYMELYQDTSTGMLYGVTQRGGYPGGGGVIYGFNPANNQLTRYFVGTIGDSNLPWSFTGGLTLSDNGLLYGLSQGGGSQDFGTVYSFDIYSGMVQTVCSFGGASGENPNGNELFKGANNILYGATNLGGDFAGDGILFSYNLLSSTETVLKTLHDTDGSEPFGRLIQDPDNKLLYGITYMGGDTTHNNPLGYGVLYSYDTGTGVYTKLLDFNGINGIGPWGLTLVKDTSVHVIKDSDAGVSELKTKNEELRVYPNPANTMLNIEISLSKGQVAYFIMYNDIGEKIEDIQLTSEKTNFSTNNLPSGMYYYRITDKNGNLIIADKQMIMH